MAEREDAYVAFQGGGALGLAHVGAWQVLARRFKIVGTAGTSAGAIVASLCAAGYDYVHVKEIFLDLDWSEFTQPRSLSEWINLLRKREGFSDGERFFAKIKELLAKRFDPPPPKISFEFLYKETDIYLAVIACDLHSDRGIPIQFDFEHEREREVDVAFAVRASISIPGIFVAVPRRDLDQVLVDGGLLLNLPLDPLQSRAQKKHVPLIGVRFKQSPYSQEKNILDTLKGALRVALTPGSLPPPAIAQDPNYIDVVIDANKFSAFDFKITKQQKTELLHLGARAASDALLQYDLRKERLRPRAVLPFSDQKRKARNVYVSHGWRPHERPLVDYVCQLLDKSDLNPIGDAQDQDTYEVDRIKFIMSLCGGYVAIIPDRGEGKTSPYIFRETKLAQDLGLPCLIVAEATVILEENFTKQGIHVSIDATKEYNAALSSLEIGIESLKEEWKYPLQMPYAFVATRFDSEFVQIERQIVQLIQNITAMPCIIGDKVRESQFIQQHITERISRAEFVIADLSNTDPNSWNVNTCIEAGIARGTNRKLHLICKGLRRKPPFMFFDRQIDFYTDDSELLTLIHELVFPNRCWIFKGL